MVGNSDLKTNTYQPIFPSTNFIEYPNRTPFTADPCPCGTAGREYDVGFTLFALIAGQFTGCLESYINPSMPSLSPNTQFSSHGRPPTAPGFWDCIKPRLRSTKPSTAALELHPLPTAKDQMRQEVAMFTMFSLQPQLRLP